MRPPLSDSRRAGGAEDRHRAPATSGESTAVDRALAAELIRRAAQDQQVRARTGKSPQDYQRWRAIDADNLSWLRRLVDETGWPGPARVGPVAATAAWLLAQHADHDLPFQVRCLRLLREQMLRGDVPLWQVAFLADRVFASAGGVQPFGTQTGAAAGGLGDPASAVDRQGNPMSAPPAVDRQWWEQAAPALTALRAAMAGAR